MSIKFAISSEKTNSYRGSPWAVSADPFLALRGKNQSGKVFFPFTGFNEGQIAALTEASKVLREGIIKDSGISGKVIKTKKGTELLVPAEGDSQNLLFLMCSGGFRGGFSAVKAEGGARIIRKWSASKHCVEIVHVIAELPEPGSYIWTDTGRRCTSGDVEVYTFDKYKRMDREEYDLLAEVNPTEIAK